MADKGKINLNNRNLNRSNRSRKLLAERYASDADYFQNSSISHRNEADRYAKMADYHEMMERKYMDGASVSGRK